MHFDMIDHRRLLRAAGAALALGVVMAPAAAKACNPFEFLFGGCRESVRPRPIETIPVEGPIAKPKRKASAGVAHVAKQVAIAPPVGAKVGSVAHFAEDKTLRSGDVVVTPNGFLVYRGHSGARNGDDFQPLAKARSDLATLEKASRGPRPSYEPTGAPGSMTPVSAIVDAPTKVDREFSANSAH